MNRQRGLRTLAGVFTLALLATGCDDKNNNTNPAPGPAASTSSPASASPVAKPAGPAPTYKLPAKLCDITTATGFADLYPSGITTKTDSTVGSVGICQAQVGSTSAGIGLSVGVEITTAEKAKQQFDYLKKRIFAENRTAKEIPNLGDGAYVFTDEALGGVRLVVLHGNAHNSVAAKKLGSASYPPDINDRLARNAAELLTKLPTG